MSRLSSLIGTIVDTTNASFISEGTLDADLLEASGVSAGTYGSSTQVPVIVIDDKGRITSASNTNVSGGGGGSGITYLYKTSNYTISSGEGILANTSAGSFTLTLPSSPSVGDYIEIADSGDFWETNNVTVSRNGSTIENFSEDLILNVPGASVKMIYDGITWNVYTQIGALEIAQSVSTQANLAISTSELALSTANAAFDAANLSITLDSANTAIDNRVNESFVSNLGFATVTFVEETAEGLQTKPAVELATVANLDATYDNGTLGVGGTLTANTNGAFPEIDGITLTSTTLGENGVLVKNQTNRAENGRYNLTTVGDGSNPWVLTRCGLCDEANEIPGAYIFVKSGTLNAGTGWVQIVDDPDTFVVGTDNINVFQFAGVGTYTGNTGISVIATDIFNTGVISVNGSNGAITDIATTTGKLSQFASTTSSELAGVISDETGTGSLVFSNSPSLTTPDIGTPSAGNLSNCTVDGTVSVGYLIIPQNSQSTDYTLVADDSGKHILHPSADTTARTFTIPANSSVAYPVGTAITFVNQNGAGVVTIAITTDTMRLAGAGTTGSRTLAANGVATAIKITSTEWIISGVNLT